MLSPDLPKSPLFLPIAFHVVMKPTSVGPRGRYCIMVVVCTEERNHITRQSEQDAEVAQSLLKACPQLT
jgi:hypothetical protein